MWLSNVEQSMIYVCCFCLMPSWTNIGNCNLSYSLSCHRQNVRHLRSETMESKNATTLSQLGILNYCSMYDLGFLQQWLWIILECNPLQCGECPPMLWGTISPPPPVQAVIAACFLHSKRRLIPRDVTFQWSVLWWAGQWRGTVTA
jgi:hypothetical protein